jgi:hypothetical protein
LSKTALITVENPIDKELWLPCGACNRQTAHQTLTLVSWVDENLEADIKIWQRYLTVQCKGCKTVSFCEEYECTEDLYYNPATDRMELETRQQLYPNRIAGRPELSDVSSVPFEIRRVYRETHFALCSSLPVLAGIGIRAVVESVCKDKSVQGRNLEIRINALAAQGYITSDGATILHSLRFMGNEAAHKVKAHTNEELGVALDVVEYLLQGVYILPKRAERLPQ